MDQGGTYGEEEEFYEEESQEEIDTG